MSLYAAIHGIPQKDALKKVAEQIGYKNGAAGDVKPKAAPQKKQPGLISPPGGTKLPNMASKKLGKPTEYYRYTDTNGHVLFLIARYDTDDGKEFRPFSWREDGKWVNKAWPAPRPLYNLEGIEEAKNVLIVEGERAAQAAKKWSKYHVVTWPGGAKAIDKIDWSPLYGKNILGWPDHDEPGRQAAAAYSSKLLTHCPSVKIINTQDEDMEPGTDAADLDFTWSEFIEWARPLAKPVQFPSEPEIPMPSEVDATQQVTNNILAVGNEAVEQLTSQLSPNQAANIQRCGLMMTGKQATKNILNVTRVLTSDFEDKVWFDDFYGKIFTTINGPIEPWSDEHMYNLTLMIQAMYGIKDISSSLVDAGVFAFAYQRRRNDPLDWMKTISWDGTLRVENFFSQYMGAKDSAYTQAVSKNFWISMIARVYEPGCKSDAMVVLEGKQGTYKSTALKIIAGRWFATTNTSPNDKDFFLQLRGALIMEIEELDSFSKVEINTIKKTMSTQVDRYRAPYGKRVEEHPRRSVFVGTTNKDDYLMDETGARRFWPVLTGKINLEDIRRDREQLFAEAIHLYKSGHKWHEVPREEAALEQARRYNDDIWTDAVFDYISGRAEVTAAEIAVHCLKIDMGHSDNRAKQRIVKILKIAGFELSVEKRDGKTARVYKNPNWVDNQPPLPRHEVRNFAPGAEDFM